MSTQQGGGEDSGASPVDPAVAAPDAGEADALEPDTVEPDTAEAAPAARTEDQVPSASSDPEDADGTGSDSDEEPSAGPGRDAKIAAAGGTVVGESEVTGHADRSRVRRAPRYKRFAVLGGLAGLLIAAVATLLADYTTAVDEPAGVSPWGLFLLLVTILVPFLILVSCAVAMFTDRAARVPKRGTRKKKARR